MPCRFPTTITITPRAPPNSIKYPSFIYTQLNDQTVLFQTVQFNTTHLFAYSLNVKQFYLTHRPHSGATTLSLSGPGSDGNEGVFSIPQSSNITGASLSDCLMWYPGHSVGNEFYSSAEMQLVYSTALTDWAELRRRQKTKRRKLQNEKRRKLWRGGGNWWRSKKLKEWNKGRCEKSKKRKGKEIW